MNHTLRIAISVIWLAAFQSAMAKNGPPDALGGPCGLSLSIQFLDTISCPGIPDGGVYLGVTGAQGAVNYFLDSNPVPFNNPSIPNVVGAGTHRVISIDGMGCRDTVFFQLFDPPAIVFASVSTTPATCNGENSGSATATATGGRPPLNYKWQACAGGVVQSMQTAVNLYAGCYVVTATDSQGCTLTQTTAVGEPTAFDYTTASTPNLCYGDSNGTATINMTGGTQPYQYLWADGTTLKTAANLPAGFQAPTITDAAGCEVVALVQIMQPTTISVATSKTNITCAGAGNGSMKIDAVSGGTAPYSFAWSGGTVAPNGQSAAGLGSGIFIVTITDANGCKKTASQIFSDPQALQINSSATKETCFGGCDGKIALTVSFGAAPFSFAWAGPTNPGNLEDPQNLCAGTYTVTVSDASGCTTQKGSLTVAAANPILIQGTITQPGCSGAANGAITGAAFGGASGFGYKWSNGASTTTIQNLAAGAFGLTVTDALGCKKDTVFNISATPPVAIDSISTVSAIKCFGQKGALKAFAKGGTQPFSFKWDDPTAQISATATNLAAGTFSVTVTDAKACTAIAQKALSQPALLAATATATAAGCFGEASGQIALAPTGGTAPYFYVWSNGAASQNLAAVAAGAFSVTVSDKNACSTTASASVGQPASAVSITAQQTFTSCSGANKSEAQAVAAGGNGAPFSFKWSDNSTLATAKNLAPGLFKITATDSKGCTKTTDLLVAELAPIVLSVATDSTKCFGEATGTAGVNIVSGGNGNGAPAAYQYKWSTSPPQTTILAQNLAGGASYTVTATDSQGCSGTATASVPSAPPIVISTSLTHVTCAGGSDGEAEVVSVATSQPVTTLVWSQNAGSSTALLVKNLIAGVYEVSITNANGCSETATVLINEPLPIDIAFAVEPLFCNGDSTATAQAIPSGGNGSGSASYVFSWSNGETADRIGGLRAGVYALTVTDSKGCSGSNVVDVSAPNALQIAIDRVDVTCFGKKDGRLEVAANGGAQPYRFSLDGQAFGGNGSFANLGAGPYRIFVRDAGGCLTETQDEILAPEKFEIDLGPDVEIMLGDSIVLVPTFSGAQGEVDFAWRSEFTSADHCIDSLCENLMAQPLTTIHYWLNAMDEKGCSAQDILKIKVAKARGFFVPTAFSPNSDGANDRLIVFGKTKSVKKVVDFRIFDRWGELVFEDRDFDVNDETRGWDGLFNGKSLDPGEFVWWVEVEYIDGFRDSAKGATMLFR